MDVEEPVQPPGCGLVNEAAHGLRVGNCGITHGMVPVREKLTCGSGYISDLTRLIQSLTADSKKILSYGASTKGRIALQFCRL